MTVNREVNSMTDSQQEPQQLLIDRSELLNCISKLKEIEKSLYSLKLFSDAMTAHELMQSISISLSMLNDQLDLENETKA